MLKDSKIFIAGGTGMVGSAIIRCLTQKGYKNLIASCHNTKPILSSSNIRFENIDLLNQVSVIEFFKKEKPEYVFLAAAKVGGIFSNNTYRAQFIYENLQIQNNIIHNSYLNGVKKLVFLGSSCIYPRNAELPIHEDSLLTAELEYTNEPYAIAKIAGIKLCESYNIQYGTNFISVMPTNLYGLNDNYDLEKSHVLPAMIRKLHLGKCLMQEDWKAIANDMTKRPIEGLNGDSDKNTILTILKKYGIDNNSITLWGTGSPFREFLHSDDMAEGSVFIAENIDFKELSNEKKEVRNTHINIGSGTDITIKQLAEQIQTIVGYNGQVKWDHSKPDGTFRKLMDNSKIQRLGWKPKIILEEGIAKEYKNYLGAAEKLKK